MGKAYGFFEIPSVAAAIDALDIMCKAANVKFVTWEKKLGGRLVTLIIKGSVSDVTQAIEAAAHSAIKKPVATVVIANPHEEIIKLVKKSASRLGGRVNTTVVADTMVVADTTVVTDTTVVADTGNEEME